MDLVDLDRRARAATGDHVVALGPGDLTRRPGRRRPLRRRAGPRVGPPHRPGARHTLDHELAPTALDIVGFYPPDVFGTPVFFAEQQPCPADAPPDVRLVAALGRTPLCS